MTITPYDDVKWRPLAAVDAAMRIEKWHFGKGRGYWYLREPDGGYVRTLERTWAESVPRIRTILENHGLTADVS